MKSLPISLLILLAGTRLTLAGPVENFDSKPAFAIEVNTNSSNVAAVVDNPSKKGAHVLKMTWGSQTGTHASFNYTDPTVVVADKPGKYKITAHINASQVGPEVKTLAIRILDQFNETFQFSAPLKAGGPGWMDVTWLVDTVKPDTGGVPSWGVEVNNVIDLPVKILGFAFGFDDNSSPGGTLLIGDISVTKVGN